MTPGDVRVRLREPEDVPGLAATLLAQQPGTRYPFRDPLPVPVEDFLHASDAVRAWTAELAGRPVGHVCHVGPARGLAAADVLDDLCARAHGCEVGRLAWLSALFVAPEARGVGLGRRRLAAVVDDAVRCGLRPDWLREAAGEEGADVQVMVRTVPDPA